MKVEGKEKLNCIEVLHKLSELYRKVNKVKINFLKYMINSDDVHGRFIIDLNEVIVTKYIRPNDFYEVIDLIVDNDEYLENRDLIKLNCELEIDRIEKIRSSNITLNVITIGISLLNLIYIPFLDFMKKNLENINPNTEAEVFFRLFNLINSFMGATSGLVIFLLLFILLISQEINTKNRKRYNSLKLTLECIEEIELRLKYMEEDKLEN